MMLARGPESVAKGMGQSVGYNAASNVAGSELGQEAAHAADTMANLDRILKEHPDAVNAAELAELRRNLEQPPPGSDRDTGEQLDEDGIEADASVHPPLARRASPYDRRSGDFATPRRGAHGVLSDDNIGLPEQRLQTHNRLRVERAQPADQRWRITDQHRFHSPKLTSFGEDIPTPAVQSLTGEDYAPREFRRITLPKTQ